MIKIRGYKKEFDKISDTINKKELLNEAKQKHKPIYVSSKGIS